MAAQSWWGTGLQIGAGIELRDLTQAFPGEEVFREAQKLTIRMRRVCIREDLDGFMRGDNDLAIATTYQFGPEPPVQRLHFLRNGVPLGCEGDFFDDFILSVRDFKDRIVTLRFQVYDVDGVSANLIDEIQGVAQSVAVTFPVTAPIAGIAGFGAPALLKLVNGLDDHDRIIDKRLKLEIRAPGTGHNLLQPGYFVCFSQPVEAGLRLSSSLNVERADGSEFTDFSYGVLQVTRTDERFAEVEIDQKIAKLLSELDGKGQSGKAPIEFLRDTLSGYANFRKLRRVTELKAKDPRTGDEEALLQELLEDEAISDYTG